MNVNVTVSSGFNITATNGVSAAWVDANYYPRTNPSGYTTTGSNLDSLFSIPLNVNSVTITGLAWRSVPRVIITSVCSPNSTGLLLYSSVDLSTISQSGFTANLNGFTDTTGYLLAYHVIL